MQPLTLKQRQPAAETVENWDDDGDFEVEGFEALPLRTASTATSVASSSHPHHRDSVSSRFSVRSDHESTHGDEDWQVLVDEGKTSADDAIAAAKARGIPIPENVPASALLGGTIRRLGGKKIKKAMGDDWSEDLDFLGAGELKLNKADENDFAESLRQISAAFKNAGFPTTTTEQENRTVTPKALPPSINLESFKDADADDFGDIPTIKVQKSRHKPINLDTGSATNKPNENIEEDLELPSDGKLRLSQRREAPRTPHQDDDIDLEWAEGSLGTRHGGTRRENPSGRSSSVSALSPSVSSCLTGESEDEGLDGLVLPNGPLKFDEALKKRHDNSSPDPANYSGEKQAAKRAAAKDDFFSGLEIGDGDVFDSGKLTLNKNIKHKVERQKSPTRKIQTTLTFTSKTSTTTTQTASTRIPRFHHGMDRPRSTLEPVSETGQSVPRFRRPGSRLGHSQQSSVSSIPTPLTPSTPSTPSRRPLNPVASRDTLRHEPTTTSAQLLRAKRSMPAMRLQSPTKNQAYARPPSRNEGGGSRLQIPARPKTPTAERSESRLEALRRPPVPFLPGGSVGAQSHHISIKTSRHLRRHDSDGSIEIVQPGHRPSSRLSNRRPETPGSRRDLAPAELAANAKRQITKPSKRRNFGDGTELDIFDDLPTSTTMESKFTKQPIGRGAPRVRNKLGQSFANQSVSSIATSRTETPMPSTPRSPTRQENIPRFARDTAASRAAREQRQVSSTLNPRETGGVLAPVSANWKSRIAGFAPIPQAFRKRNKAPAKPQLIKPLGNGMNEAKSVKGMQYNPLLFRWEGNENALAPFDVPQPTLLTPTSPKPAPALITNVGSLATGVQISGGMIFDPQRMCWLKMASQQRDSSGTASLRGGVGSVQLEEEEDVFAGLEDLREEDEANKQSTSRKVSGDNFEANKDEDEPGAGGDSSDEFMVSEEFDVGPEFVRRQRAEEDKWSRKVGKWIRGPEDAEAGDPEGRVEWRWAIRGLALAG
ncbi:putative cytokinesis regulator [Phaeomoniella chlamydospora]|uniref:Putative cytokinesis regulator n=1 Tax=Phaeomoniella chlamydospora TaxID=158046 RepID=A0A0G2E0L3_PHACM|nr:putative cytokinesis regulator [Phaeomoniella chlamydospora]